ncbi:glucuronyl hydrolase [Pedobacter hiemivivus]|uniref:Glucuronyl hydrolase n=1 Tax=Pedobacter hiemivivus TaxID=2530454 RepID=A0A4R0ME49_9SPHI|nr:glycoside hydrolase family 88 protein [Pedobacter hiemivivus]TCC84503.1 glucuronyl hydrolase [Pedobacter hiemivivus]TKC55190.1 glucuronyl hydrolase [Pedobacter hiemivivus]
MRKLLFTVCLLATAGLASAQQANGNKVQMKELIDEQFRFAEQQYKVLAKNVPAQVMPKTYNLKTNKVETSDTKWWTSGFYPGSLLYIYEYTKDPTTLKEAELRLATLEKEKHYTGNHDLGFMMFCSFGNAYRITKSPKYRPTIDTAAASLITRYRPNAKVIQSWNSSKKWKGPVIIDNLMNLELLAWVTDHGGDAKYKKIAINHANTSMKNHFRPDYSSYHVVDYDMKTGAVVKRGTAQGAFDASAWSRGQGWALYGYTMMYRFTKEKRYLNLAKNIASFILNHPNMPADKVPYWDFDAPGIPNTYRDASAAAVIASALLELGQYTEKKDAQVYIDAAEEMITSLSSDAYRAKAGQNGGFLLMHSTGALPLRSEVDVPLTYADYYYLEALMRYKNWYL